SKDSQRIHRRSRAPLYRQRRECDHELVTFQAPGCINSTLEIEILHNAYAHPFHDHLMDRVSDDALSRAPTRSWIPVDIEIVTEKRRFPLFDPRQRIRKIACDLPGPGPGLRAALPSPDVQRTTSPGPAFRPTFFSHASRSARVIGVPGSIQSTPFN